MDGSYRGLTTMKGFFFSSARDDPNEFLQIWEVQAGCGAAVDCRCVELVTRLVDVGN